MEETLKLKPQGRTQLALQYSPDVTPAAAWRRLKLWIDVYPGLNERLKKAGYSHGQRMFTGEQISIIFEALGEP